MVFTNPNKHSSFAAGALMLALSGIVVKLIGVCYKIPLMRLIGAQGMGYFNTAYDVYALLCVISTTGLPVAVSVVINRHPALHKRVFRLSLGIFALLGVTGMCGVFFAADRIAAWVGAPEAAQSLRFIAPAVLFICLSGALRGYEQARRNMLPTAMSQVVEAAGKLLFGLVFAHLALRRDATPAAAAAFAILGLSVGTLHCLFYLTLCQKRQAELKVQSDNSAALVRELLKVAFPVTLGALVAGLSKVIDLSLIMRRLQDGGMAQGSAVAMYGCYSSMVIPLFGAVPALFSALALPLVPHLGHAINARDTDKQTQILQTAFRWGAVISVPAALGMAMLSKQILQLLFSDTAETAVAVPMLLIISAAIPASCMITVTSAVLQAYGHPWQPMIATAMGCLVKAACIYLLCPNPGVGILAAPVSTLLCCLVTAALNFAFVGRCTPAFVHARHWLLSLLAAALSVGVAALVCRCVTTLYWQVALGVAVAMLLYFGMAYLCGLVRISDIKSLKSYE